MEKVIVQIDLDSIKKNKRVGETISHVPGRREISFVCKSLPSFFEEGKDCIVTEKSFNIDESVKELKGYIFNPSLIEKCISEKSNISISENIERQAISHMPIREYSYSYEETKVTCCECNESFPYTELQDYEDFDYNYYERICPKCGESECCSFEYEEISEALTRKEDCNG